MISHAAGAENQQPASAGLIAVCQFVVRHCVMIATMLIKNTDGNMNNRKRNPSNVEKKAKAIAERDAWLNRTHKTYLYYKYGIDIE